MSSIESSYYENKDFWSGELFEEADRLRFDYIISNIDSNVRSLLDVGCGNGLFLKRVNQLRPDIEVLHGVDRSDAALKHVRFPTTRASADAVPLESRSFDCVTCLEVVEHLPIEIYKSAIGELARISRRQLLISVPYEQDLSIGRVECPACRTLFNPDYHLRSFSQRSLASLFESYGYGLRHSQPFGVSREFALVRQIDALKRRRENRFPVDVPCPVCGQVLPARPAATDANASDQLAGRGGFKHVIKSLWPKVDVPRWLLANYALAEKN